MTPEESKTPGEGNTQRDAREGGVYRKRKRKPRLVEGHHVPKEKGQAHPQKGGKKAKSFVFPAWHFRQTRGRLLEKEAS